MAAAVVASVAGFYVFPTGKVNNFPTYLVAVSVLLHVAMWPRSLRIVIRGRPAVIGQALLAYLLLVTLLATELDEAIDVGKYALLIALFLPAVQLCASSFTKFSGVLARVTVGCALASAVHYLVTTLVLDGGAPWGRLHVKTIAATSYGFASALALALLLGALRLERDPGSHGKGFNAERVERIMWGCGSLVLAYTAAKLGEDYVLFGLLTSGLVVSIAFVWSQRMTPRVTLWLPLVAALLAVQMMVFSAVIETERPVIWHSVTDAVFDGGALLGAGLQDQVQPVLDCGSSMLKDRFGDCRVDHPHSIYVSTLHHGGIVGLALLVLVLLVSLGEVVDAPPSDRRTIALVSLVYGMAVLMFDGSTVVQKVDFVWLLFWLPVALAAGLQSESDSGRE